MNKQFYNEISASPLLKKSGAQLQGDQIRFVKFSQNVAQQPILSKLSNATLLQ
jgi:hypothetical protein